ncbi:MAG: hypothetical protein AAGJ87_17175 [Pseudomonadota bacterium]
MSKNYDDFDIPVTEAQHALTAGNDEKELFAIGVMTEAGDIVMKTFSIREAEAFIVEASMQLLKMKARLASIELDANDMVAAKMREISGDADG